MNRYIFIVLLAWSFVSCYEDKGNYKYHDINEITVDSIADFYTIDQFDTLRITPTMTGTQYSDTARFYYTWEIDGKVVSNSFELETKIMNSPGEKYCRLIVQDKDNGVREYFYFRTNVVSTTAVDGLMLLSNYDGHAEMSFKRVDREEAPFQVNFYYEMNKTYLGTVPKKMVQFYNNELNDQNDMFGLHIIVDNDLHRVSYKTLMEDEVHPIYNKDYFKSIIPVNPSNPDFGTFLMQNVSTEVLSWMGDFMGPFQRATMHQFISGGKYFMTLHSIAVGGVQMTSYLRESELGGELSSVYAFVGKKRTWSLGSFFYDIGYSVSNNILLFDRTHHRFVYGNYTGQWPFRPLPGFESPDLNGWEPVFASPTRNANNPIFILTNGSQYRCITFRAPQNDTEYSNGIQFKVVSDIPVPVGEMSARSDFYCYITDEDFYYSNGFTLYSVNLQSLINGTWEAKAICQLSDFGYDSQATINCFDFARSGKVVALGIATDGKPGSESSDALNGDVLLLDISKATKTVTLRKKFQHVGGSPADIFFKYLSYFCEGYDENGSFRDYL